MPIKIALNIQDVKGQVAIYLENALFTTLKYRKKTCPHCQGFLSLIDEEVSEQLEWVRPFLKAL